MKNRRKDKYGELDGNPLSLKHFQELDQSIKKDELEKLVEKGILKRVSYLYKVCKVDDGLSDDALWILEQANDGIINYDALKSSKEIKKRKLNAQDMLSTLE